MILETIISNSRCVPQICKEFGNGNSIARKLDMTLMDLGFKLSKDLYGYLSCHSSEEVEYLGKQIVSIVSKMVGAHVKHNTKYKEFPNNFVSFGEVIDDYYDLWCRHFANFHSKYGQEQIDIYGRYCHSYEEMASVHDALISSMKNKVTVLHLGDTLEVETLKLYHKFAGSNVPLNEQDRGLLVELTKVCLEAEQQPEFIPVRENRALINSIRIKNNKSILVDTITDVLRLAVVLSGGDVALETISKFKSFPRKIRKQLMLALEGIIVENPNKLSDVNKHQELWKRLGERLHPHEFSKLSYANDVFAVARGDQRVSSIVGKAELAFANNDLFAVIDLLEKAPGYLFRNVDRILLASNNDKIIVDALCSAIKGTAHRVSGRVLLSLREHLVNRTDDSLNKRMFFNTKGKSWVADETRDIFNPATVQFVVDVIDEQVKERLPVLENLVIDDSVLSLALPLSEKNKSSGFGIMPKGSICSLSNTDLVRFFVYWKEQKQRTDYDLSVFLLDKDFKMVSYCSWTQLRDGAMVHSGDITSAPNGASEFIDVKFNRLNKEVKYIVPQVNVFCGDSYKDTESFFGFMERDVYQKGMPFEAKTVKMKSDMTGTGKIALPLVIFRDDKSNTWKVKWCHLYQNGTPNFNMVERNHITASMQVEALVKRQFITVGYIAKLLKEKSIANRANTMTYIGINKPEQSNAEIIKAFTLENLIDLIPA